MEEIENNVEEPVAIEEKTPVTASEEPSEPNKFDYNSSDANLKRMREAKERAERELEEYKAKHPPVQPKQYDEEDSLIGEDDLVEGKHLKKVDNKIAQLEKKIKEHEEERIENQVTNRLSSEFSDYSKVVTQENFDKFVKEHPEIAQSISNAPNRYVQYKSIYKMIKQFGIHAEDKNKVEKDRIAANSEKPIPSNLVGPKVNAGPLSQASFYANGLTEEAKREFRRLNEAARRNY